MTRRELLGNARDCHWHCTCLSIVRTVRPKDCRGEIAARGQLAHGLLAEIGINLVLTGERAYAERAVLALR